jgi:hypothetical protein
MAGPTGATVMQRSWGGAGSPGANRDLESVRMQGPDPRSEEDERAAGLAMLGTIFFFVVVGVGVGVFLEQPVTGGIGGGVLGIAFGLWLVPRLLRDWE